MRLNITIVMATLSTTLTICVGYLAIAGTAKPRPDRYRADVIQLLDQRQVDYRRVEVVDGCAPSYQLLLRVVRSQNRSVNEYLVSVGANSSSVPQDRRSAGQDASQPDGRASWHAAARSAN
jgi:hypothetical protein